MNRALVLATLLVLSSGAASGQALVVLRITVTLTDAARASTPVPRHALLISDNPSSSPPRRILTKIDGTVEVSLRPGSYIVESDEPVAFNGKGYLWTQIVELKAGQNAVLALSEKNAEVGDAPASSPSAPASVENSPSLLLAKYQDSLVSIWTPESRASGFVVDAAGLVVTNQRAIGTATAIEVQLTPVVKVPARVIAADIARDVVVLWIDPSVVASTPPLPLACGDGSPPRLVDKQPIAALSAPLRGSKDVTEGEMTGTSAADLRLAPGGGGGPVLNLDGAVVGLTTIVDRPDARRRNDEVRVVPIATLCDAVATATKAMATAARPVATHLPVEPALPAPADAPKSTAKRDGVQMSLYQVASSGFDITFLTPDLIERAHDNTGRTGLEQDKLSAATDFGNWSDYFSDVPPVLVVRVTPKFSESFWAKVARGAAYTQGAVLPPLKRFQPGFARMQAFCGDTEVTPIHPFTLARRISETDAVREGLYVFDPQALGPQCKSVRLVLFSEKEPTKPDPKVVEAPVIERVWHDFSNQKG